MEKPFLIYFEDLKDNVKKDFLEWANIKDEKEANLDIIPLSTLPFFELKDFELKKNK